MYVYYVSMYYVSIYLTIINHSYIYIIYPDIYIISPLIHWQVHHFTAPRWPTCGWSSGRRDAIRKPSPADQNGGWGWKGGGNRPTNAGK